MNGQAMTMHSMTTRQAAGSTGSRKRSRCGHASAGRSLSRIFESLHDLVDLRARERYEARRQPL